MLDDRELYKKVFHQHQVHHPPLRAAQLQVEGGGEQEGGEGKDRRRRNRHYESQFFYTDTYFQFKFYPRARKLLQMYIHNKTA